MRERRILSTNFVELANEGHGEHRASREAGDGAYCGREEGKLHPDRIGCEMVAGRAAYEAEREPLMFDYFYFYSIDRVYGVPIRQKITTREGKGIFFSFRNFGFIFIVFMVCCCAVLCLLFGTYEYPYEYRHRIYKKKKKVPYLGYVRTTSATRSSCSVRAVFS